MNLRIPPRPLPGEQAIVGLAFLLLFPVFFFYHTLLGLGMTSAFLGGYFTPVTLLIALPLYFIYGNKVRANHKLVGKADLFFFGFVLYFFAVIAVNAAAGANRLIVTNHVFSTLFMIHLFIIFKIADFSQPGFQRLAVASLLIMSAIVFYFTTEGSFYLGTAGLEKDRQSLATYQGFSRSYLFVFMVIIPYTRSRRTRIALYCLAAAGLFLNATRSEFVALLFLIPVIELYYSRHKLMVVTVLILLILMVKMNLDGIVELIPDNRILELLDLSQSTSATLRHHLRDLAVQTISAHPLLGDYASYLPGDYAHNILSAWVDLGLFGVIFLLSLLILPTANMFYTGYFAKEKSGDFLLGFCVASITLLLLLTSHYFADMLIGATLGSYSKYRDGRHYAKDRTPYLGPPAPRYQDLRQAVPQSGRARL